MQLALTNRYALAVVTKWLKSLASEISARMNDPEKAGYTLEG